jgi:hypothetical protein
VNKTTLVFITKIFLGTLGIAIDPRIRGRNVLSSHMNLVNN